MSAAEAACWTAAIVATLIVAALYAICRAAGQASRHEEAAAAACEELRDLDTHLNAYVAADPELAAGLNRLWHAIRDEQQNGDQP